MALATKAANRQAPKARFSVVVMVVLLVVGLMLDSASIASVNRTWWTVEGRGANLPHRRRPGQRGPAASAYGGVARSAIA